MADALSALLETRDALLLDGATGTNLFAMGLEAGEPPELWNAEHPDRVRRLHDGFVEAGSDVILTNSFGANRHRLALHGAEDRVEALAEAAARIARERADAAGRPVVVAGSMGPTGEIMAPVGSLSHEDAVAAFRAQARGLMAGGADVLWAETISAVEEMRAASEAAALEGAPFCATLSFDTAGRTMMGVTSADWARLAPGLPAPPVALGANCGVGSADLLRTVLGLAEADPQAVVIAKGNAGIPKFVEGEVRYDGTPGLMADYVRLALDAGARLVGGCCGTTFAHVAAMRAAMDAHEPGPRPDLATVEARLGGFSSASDGTGEGVEEGGARGGGRRRRRA
jgi:5-methyltetrahydrofolate--homocysteine methyltransferase